MSPEDRKATGQVTLGEALEARAIRQECDLQAQICDYLRLRGVRAIVRARMDKKTTTTVGTADLCFCWHGRPFALEVKMPGRKATSAQEAWMRDACEDGWICAVVTHLDDVKNLLS